MSNDQYSVSTNVQDPSGKWTIYSDDQGTICGRYESPDNVRDHLTEIGLTTIRMDVDSNGSYRDVPVAWIGDGEPLVGSDRALKLA